jgi:zinc transporter, ZIP family
MALRPTAHAPGWALGLVAVLLLGAALAALAVPGDRALPEGEDLVVERTVLSPGAIELTVRNTGSDPVQIAQAFVNDSYVDVTGANEPIGRLATDTLRLDYPWRDGQPYLVSLLTGDGAVIEHEISGAADTPGTSPAYLGWMALLGTCVGVGAVLLGFLLMPVLQRAWPTATRMLVAVTVGLLAFLVFDGTATSLELAQRTGAAFGGAALVVLGAGVAFLLLTGVDHGFRLAVRRTIGMGLHNLCAGLAIGSAYAVGEVAVGVALVTGFALYNAVEGGAIVAPLALALLAGTPAIVGTVLGASVDNPELSTFLLGVGVGTVVQAVVRLAPRLRERAGGIVPSTLYGVLAGVLIMYLTGLLPA